MVNYQVTVLLDRLLSNGLAILGANYYYVHTVCVQVTITQIKLYICKGKSFFTVYLFNEWQLFTSWFNSFSFLVYKMWCTVIMHIQNWNDSPVTMLKWATIGPPLHFNEWAQLLLVFLLLLPLRVHARMWARMRGEVRSMVWHINKNVNICEKTFDLHLYGRKWWWNWSIKY